MSTTNPEYRASLPHGRDQFQAVHLGHVPVDEHDVGKRTGLELLEGFFAVAGVGCFKAEFFEDFRLDAADGPRVVNNESPHANVSPWINNSEAEQRSPLGDLTKRLQAPTCVDAQRETSRSLVAQRRRAGKQAAARRGICFALTSLRLAGGPWPAPSCWSSAAIRDNSLAACCEFVAPCVVFWAAWATAVMF